MWKNRKIWTAKQKFEVVLELLKWRKTQNQITTEYWVHASQQNNRKEQFIKEGLWIFERKKNTEEKRYKKEKEKMERLIGQYAFEVDWLKKKIGKP